MEFKISEEKLLKELIRLLERRENIKSLTEYYYSTSDIYNLTVMYYKLTGEDLGICIKSNNKLANRMKKYIGDVNTNLYYYFLNIDKHTELASNVIKTYDESDFIFYNRRCVNKLTEKEFLEIQRDFLASHDERMLKLFNSHLERGLIDMRGNNDAGVHLTFCSNNHYVVLPDQYNITNLSAISHEIGHLFGYTILDLRSKKQLNNSNMTYYESISHYMELCLYEYLKKNHIYLSDTLIEENDYYSRIKEYFESLYICKDIDTNKCDDDDLLDISDSYTYSYGILIGTYLHERYIENPTDVKKDIDNYLFYQGLLDKDKELEILGLSQEELNNTKVLSKKLQKHTENYKKYN